LAVHPIRHLSKGLEGYIVKFVATEQAVDYVGSEPAVKQETTQRITASTSAVSKDSQQKFASCHGEPQVPNNMVWMGSPFLQPVCLPLCVPLCLCAAAPSASC